MPSCGIPPIGELEHEPVVAEDLVLEEDLLDDVVRRSDEVRAPERRRRVVVGATHGWPAPLLADPVHRGRDVRERLVERLLPRLREVAVRVDAQSRRLAAGLGGAAAVELGERREPLRQPADDRERHRQAEHPRADGRLRRAADGDPDGQRLLQRPRVHAVTRRASRRSRGCAAARSSFSAKSVSYSRRS